MVRLEEQLVSMESHWLTVKTTESSLTSGCGEGRESAQDGCKGTCMKL